MSDHTDYDWFRSATDGEIDAALQAEFVKGYKQGLAKHREPTLEEVERWMAGGAALGGTDHE